MRMVIRVMHGVNHRAGAEKQQRLEEGVRDQMEHASSVCATADAHKHVAQLGHCGVGQHLLDVPLTERDRGGEQGRECPDGRDHQRGLRSPGEDRRGTGHEIHTGGHHRRRVDQCRHRRRTSHGVGQPDVQRQLSALARATDEQKEGNRQHDRRASHTAQRRVGTDEVELLRRDPNQEHGDEEPKVTDPVHDKSFLPRFGVGLVAEPETDQQIRREADAFPADEQHGITSAEHEHQHERHEKIQIREVPRVARIVAHVANGKQMDQRADAGDHEDHQNRQLVELEAPVNDQIAHRHPLPVANDMQRLFGCALHVEEQGNRYAERRQNHARTNDRDERVARRGRAAAVRPPPEERDRSIGEEAKDR